MPSPGAKPVVISARHVAYTRVEAERSRASIRYNAGGHFCIVDEEMPPLRPESCMQLRTKGPLGRLTACLWDVDASDTITPILMRAWIDMLTTAQQTIQSSRSQRGAQGDAVRIEHLRGGFGGRPRGVGRVRGSAQRVAHVLRHDPCGFVSCVARALCAEGSWLCAVINDCLSVSLSESSLHDMLCRHVISQAVQA